MKGLTLLFVLGIVLNAEAQRTGAQTCPNVSEDPEEDILLPHESDCTKFYKCSHGEKVLQDCPDDLHFNPETNQCDWPHNVDCKNGGGETEENKNSREEGTCPSVIEDPEEDILLPHESDCTKFYKCSHGEKVLQDCPDDLYFNPEINQCDWPHNVDCKNGGGETEENKDSHEEGTCPSVIEDPEEDILLPHESDCTKFYKCSHGEKVQMDCPDGLHYNPKQRYCDWPHNTNCTNNGTTPALHPQNLLPHETDCTKFYLIFTDIQFEYSCPAELHFNVELGVCDYKSNVRCQIKPSNNDETSKNINNPISN